MWTWKPSIAVWHVLRKQANEKKPLVFIKNRKFAALKETRGKNFTRAASEFRIEPRMLWNSQQHRVTCNKCQNVFLILSCFHIFFFFYSRRCWHYIFIWSNSITSFPKFLFTLTSLLRFVRSKVEHLRILFFTSVKSKSTMSNKNDSHFKWTKRKAKKKEKKNIVKKRKMRSEKRKRVDFDDRMVK